MGRFREETRTVLPPLREQLHEAADRELSYDPILTAPVGALLLRFVDEYFFIQLYRAMLESHASENGARLLAMTAAGTNIDRKLVDLTKAFQTARQENVTSELLDVVGGAEAALRRPGETLG